MQRISLAGVPKHTPGLRLLHPPSGGSGVAHKATPFFCLIFAHRTLCRCPNFVYHARPSNATIFQMKTFIAKPSTIKRQWYVIDASDKVLGRVAAEVAHRLRGKHKPEYTPNIDTGDYIIVVNAGKIRVSGGKERGKFYYQYSGYQSGLKRLSVAQLRARRPERIVEHAVRGMLPKNSLGREMFRKLKVYAGADHKHAAQEPKSLAI